MKLFDSVIGITEKSLNAYSKRSEALANNISNINTPNYKRQDVEFESYLQEALDEGNTLKLKGTVTNNKHFDINKNMSLAEIEPISITETSTFMRNDKNNVDIEKEQAEFAKNNIKYQFGTTRISQDFALLKTLIKSK